VLKESESKGERIQERFITGYASLLRLIRKNRPAVPIVSLLGDAASMSACQRGENKWYSDKLTKFIHKAHNRFGNDENTVNTVYGASALFLAAHPGYCEALQLLLQD